MENKMRLLKETDFEELERLSLPLNKWLQKNYDLHTSIILECGYVKIVQDRCGMPLPIDD